MASDYLARSGRVWQHKRSGKVLGERLTLKDGEKLTDYRQVQKPAKPKEPGDVMAKAKTKTEPKPETIAEPQTGAGRSGAK